MDGIKNANKLKDYEIVRIMNKVVDYYRDNLVYEFDEEEANTILKDASDTSIEEAKNAAKR